MKLYRTTNGTWVGTQKDWKDTQRAEGNDAAGLPDPVEVPITPKEDLIRFLNDLTTGQAPQAAPAPVTTPTIIHAEGPIDLDELFEKAPMKQRLRLAVAAIDAADDLLTKAMNALRARSAS